MPRSTDTSSELAKLWARIANDVNQLRLHRQVAWVVYSLALSAMEPTSAASIRLTTRTNAWRAKDSSDGATESGALLIQFPVSFKEHGVDRGI
jgi:hypothetical protein